MLWDRVVDLVPRRLRADEDVQARAHARIAVDRAQCDAEALGVRAVVPEERRAAAAAEAARDAGRRFVARDLGLAREPAELGALRRCVAAERGAVLLAAHRAVAVRGAREPAGDLVTHGP